MSLVVVTHHDSDGSGLLRSAEQLIERLEGLWSRFQPTSEISRLNSHGRADDLSAETVQLVQRAITGWRATAGLFDPTILPALIASGYDRTFAELDADTGTDRRPTGPSPGCEGITVESSTGTVRLPSHLALDPGGLGKGYAADLVTATLMTAGAAGACVNLGGDLRTAGDAPEGRGWVCSIEDPLATGREIARIRLDAGGVASTSRTKRRWGMPGCERHHLIDPRTGGSAHSGLAGVSIISGDAWWAEVLATASFVAGLTRGLALIEAAGASGLFVTDDGDIVLGGDVERFLV